MLSPSSYLPMSLLSEAPIHILYDLYVKIQEILHALS